MKFTRLQLFSLFFAYSLLTAIVFQEFLVPNLNPLSTLGLIGEDSTHFHLQAIQLSNAIQLNGWGAWSIFPSESSSINVSILAILYTFFGYKPSLLIPINALIHASSGVVIFQIAIELSRSLKTGFYAGLIASSLFVLSPSALNWYGQIHKDGWLILGMLLIVLSMTQSMDLQSALNIKTLKHVRKSTFICILGLLFVAVSRPYTIKLLIILLTAWLLIYLFINIKHLQSRWNSIAFLTVTILLSIIATKVVNNYFPNANQGDQYTNYSQENWVWQKSDWLPSTLDAQLETASRTRIGFIYYSEFVNAKSNIDGDIKPSNAKEMLRYLPRALQISTFAPFPNVWFKEITAFKLVSILEMSVSYLCLVGLLFLFKYPRWQKILFIIFLASSFLTILGYIGPNLGTLYRVRFGYEYLLIILGIVGWTDWYFKKYGRKGLLGRDLDDTAPQKTHDLGQHLETKNNHSRKSVLSSGILLALITFIGFFLFFLRDIFLAKSFGVNEQLDEFFIAFLIPMFAVSVLSTPLGNAFMPNYQSLRASHSNDISAYVSKISNATFWMAASASIILLILTPTLMSLFGYNFPPSHASGLKGYIYFTPVLIFLLSSQLIIGNAILNAHNRSHVPALAQLIVPLTAILAVFIFHNSYGIPAILISMLVGQWLNYLIINREVKKLNLSVIPKLSGKVDISLLGFKGLYLPLISTAFFTAVAPTVATFFTLQLPHGNLSAFNLGNKVILFITGLLSTLVSTLLLPYFSNLIAENKKDSARKELAFFINISNAFSIPFCLIVFVFSNEIAIFLFKNSKIQAVELDLIARVIQYAVIQVPFFLTGLIFLKFCIAFRQVKVILLIGLFSLILNIALAYTLLKYMAINGVVLAYTISVIFSAISITILNCIQKHFKLRDFLNLVITWLLFISFLVSLHFSNLIGSYFVVFISLLLIFDSFKFGVSNRFKLLLNTPHQN